MPDGERPDWKPEKDSKRMEKAKDRAGIAAAHPVEMHTLKGRAPGIGDEPNPEPPVVPEPRGPVVKIYGSAGDGEVVRVHGLVDNQRRTVHLHRQELEKYGDDHEGRRLDVARHLARVTPEEMEPVIADPWTLRGVVRLPEGAREVTSDE